MDDMAVVKNHNPFAVNDVDLREGHGLTTGGR